MENNPVNARRSPAQPAASITITGSRNVNVAASRPVITATLAGETQQLFTDLADYLQRHAAQLAVRLTVPAGPRRSCSTYATQQLGRHRTRAGSGRSLTPSARPASARPAFPPERASSTWSKDRARSARDTRRTATDESAAAAIR